MNMTQLGPGDIWSREIPDMPAYRCCETCGRYFDLGTDQGARCSVCGDWTCSECAMTGIRDGEPWATHYECYVADYVASYWHMDFYDVLDLVLTGRDLAEFLN